MILEQSRHPRLRRWSFSAVINPWEQDFSFTTNQPYKSAVAIINLAEQGPKFQSELD